MHGWAIRRRSQPCRECGRAIRNQGRDLCAACWRRLIACLRCRRAPRAQGQTRCDGCGSARQMPARQNPPGHEARIERYAERAARLLPLFEDN